MLADAEPNAASSTSAGSRVVNVWSAMNGGWPMQSEMYLSRIRITYTQICARCSQIPPKYAPPHTSPPLRFPDRPFRLSLTRITCKPHHSRNPNHLAYKRIHPPIHLGPFSCAAVQHAQGAQLQRHKKVEVVRPIVRDRAFSKVTCLFRER